MSMGTSLADKASRMYSRNLIKQKKIVYGERPLNINACNIQNSIVNQMTDASVDEGNTTMAIT